MSYNFNAEETRDNIVKWLQDYAKKSGFNKVVIGISGGKDSTVTAALCVRALGKENVYGVILPDGIQKDIKDSFEVVKALEIKSKIFDIETMHNSLLYITEGLHLGEKDSFQVPYVKEANINVAPRLRMTVLRYITQALGARLVGTGNLSEITVGYFTKDGDQSCDFSLIANLTSVEVVQIGLTMPEIPEHLVKKTPSDGLCGLSDEEKLGVSYQDIHDYIRYPILFAENHPEVANKIRDLHIANLHKINSPMRFFLELKYG